MLRPHGYQHADGGVDKVSQLLDILAVARAHFSQENLMRGLQPFADDPGKPHGGVETGRGGEHIVLLRKQGVEDDLNAGFAVAARDADTDQSLLCIQLALRVVHIHALNALFKRQGNQRGQGDQQRQRHHKERGYQAQRDGDHAQDDVQALHARGHHKGLFFFCFALADGYQIADQHDHRRGGQIDGQQAQRPEGLGGVIGRVGQKVDAKEQRAQHRRGQNGLFPLAGDGLEIAVKLVAFQLKIVQQPPRAQQRRRGGGKQGQAGDQPEQKACQAVVPHFRNACTTRTKRGHWRR